MKKIITLITIFFILFSCSKTEEKPTTTEIKKDFLIQTKKVGDFDKDFEIIKNWKITSKSEISLQSQASWKVVKILKKDWEKVYKWENIIVLEDNISNYALNIEKAKNNIDKLNLSYDTNNINLQKNIDDLEIALQKAELNYETISKNTLITLEKANYDYNSSINNSNLFTQKNEIDIDKLEKDLSKATLDYETSIKNDDNTLLTFNENTKTLYSQMDLVYTNFSNSLDEIFWISDKNKYKNDSYEIYLWAKNSSLKNELENKIRILLGNPDILKNKNNINISNIDEELKNLEKIVLDLKDTSSLAEEVLRNSISSSSFTQTNIDNLLLSINNYSNSLQSNYSQIITLKTNLSNFLNTYLSLRDSKQKQIEILKSQIELSKKGIDIWNLSTNNSLEQTKTSLEKTKIDLDNQVKTALLNLNQSKTNLENAIQNKELTLKNIKLSIKDAQTSLKETEKNYQKLFIKSHISWIISDIKIDLWQEVSMWKELLTMVWDSENNMEFFVNSDELSNFFIWQKWLINYNNKIISWEIINISSVWNDKFNFKITVKILDKIDILWDFAKIIFKINTQKQILDINYIKISWEKLGIINILSKENKIIEKEVKIWKTLGSKVELETSLDKEDKIIITDIKNYDENKFNLKEIK